MGEGSSVVPAPRGMIEPNSGVLTLPPRGQVVYKVMRAEHLIASIEGSYLHFNRVDSYPDLPGYDLHDGAQLPADRAGNVGTRFERDPSSTAATCYDQSRARTYACCFVLENTDHIWKQYGGGGAHGRAALVFDFERLRGRLNSLFADADTKLVASPAHLAQIFSVNYGIVSYVEWDTHRANEEHLPNPVQYTFLKTSRYSAEQELRIALSAFGIGTYSVGDRPLVFEQTMQVTFDFRAALGDGGLQQILFGPDCDARYVLNELAHLGIGSALGSDATLVTLA